MAGLCPREGCKEITGGGMCIEHKREHRIKVRRLRAGVGAGQDRERRALMAGISITKDGLIDYDRGRARAVLLAIEEEERREKERRNVE